MPCQSYDENDCSGYIAQADAATKAACNLATVIRIHFHRWNEMLTPKTVKWIRAHDKKDAKRKVEEKAERRLRDTARKAKSKLSKKEREALGIR